MCLDNDAAGVAAVKRLCSGPDPILLSVMEESNVEIFVAELPDSIKDPAEFLEEHNDKDEAIEEKFRAEVIDGAQEWTRWYMNSMIIENESEASNMTSSEDRGFSRVFDNIASFLSVFEKVDDRMKIAAVIAPKLADLVHAEKADEDSEANRTEVSSSISIQLASDLIEKAGNIAHSKSMQAQRNFRFTSTNEAIVPKSLEIGNEVSIEESTRSNANRKQSPGTPNLETSSNEYRSPTWQQDPPNGYNRAQTNRKVKQFRKSMTKHISGVAASPFDDEWLGVTKDMVCFLHV